MGFQRRFVHAVQAWVEGDVRRAIDMHEEQSREHPRDLVSLTILRTKEWQLQLIRSADAADLNKRRSGDRR